METKTATWITPFKKQCFVVFGMSLTMSQMGLVAGYSSGLLPQLRQVDSDIPIDYNSGSWLASVPAISFMVGNLMISYIMGKIGRKIAYYTTLGLSLTGWLGVYLSYNLAVLLAARCIQGIAIGGISTLGPLLIGEYSSPVNRGAFLMTIAIFIGFGVFSIHTCGSYLGWRTTALICVVITVVDLLFAILSPESPSWLSSQGKYEECKKVFRWLRGDSEEVELKQMIESNIALQKAKAKEPIEESFMKRTKNGISTFGKTLKKNEFYKPFVIMIHIYAMAQWSGVNLIASYAEDFISSVVKDKIDLPLMIISLDLQRIVSNTIALIVIRKIRRRVMLFSSVGLNILILFVIAIFTYAQDNDLIPFDKSYNYYIGIVLVHLLTFAIAVGALPLSFILAGELFPLQYKSLGGGFSSLFFSINFFVNLKTAPLLFSTINVYGAYSLYACFLMYFLFVVGIMLPETKDKTLLNIEEEYKGLKSKTLDGKFSKNTNV